MKIFRANPVPNFIKSRIKTIINCHNNNENKENKLMNDKNKLTSNNLNQKVQKSDNCDKESKKNIEVSMYSYTNFVQDKLRTYFNQFISNINK